MGGVKSVLGKNAVSDKEKMKLKTPMLKTLNKNKKVD